MYIRKALKGKTRLPVGTRGIVNGRSKTEGKVEVDFDGAGIWDVYPTQLSLLKLDEEESESSSASSEASSETRRSGRKTVCL